MTKLSDGFARSQDWGCVKGGLRLFEMHRSEIQTNADNRVRHPHNSDNSYARGQILGPFSITLPRHLAGSPFRVAFFFRSRLSSKGFLGDSHDVGLRSHSSLAIPCQTGSSRRCLGTIPAQTLCHFMYLSGPFLIEEGFADRLP